jgi:hypothetical protein
LVASNVSVTRFFRPEASVPVVSGPVPVPNQFRPGPHGHLLG